MLKWADCTGAGLAAHRDEASVVQRIVGDAIFPDVVPDIGRGPLGQWVELCEVVPFGGKGLIALTQWNIASRDALILALSGYPRIQRRQLLT